MPVKTFRGKTLDMDVLSKNYGDAVAITGGVGTNVNARGDILGPGGKVVRRAKDIKMERTNKQPKSVSIATLEGGFNKVKPMDSEAASSPAPVADAPEVVEVVDETTTDIESKDTLARGTFVPVEKKKKVQASDVEL